MAKNKLKTPDWILKGEERPKEKKIGKTFKIRRCPECNSDNVGIVLSNSDAEEGGGKEWECHKCKWKGKDVKEDKLNEDEFMKYSEDKGEN